MLTPPIYRRQWLRNAFVAGLAFSGLVSCTRGDSIIGQDEPVENPPTPISGTNRNFINSIESGSLRCDYTSNQMTCHALVQNESGYQDAEGVSPEVDLQWSLAPASASTPTPQSSCNTSADKLTYVCSFDSAPALLNVILRSSLVADPSHSASSQITVDTDDGDDGQGQAGRFNHVDKMSILGDGFDGEVKLCLNYKTGVMTVTQQSPWAYVHLNFKFKDRDGLQASAGINSSNQGFPIVVQLPGNWSKVKDANPLVKEWHRQIPGLLPRFRGSRINQDRCLSMDDAGVARPGGILLDRVEWDLPD